MSKQKVHYFIICVGLLLASCKMQEQIRTVGQILASANGGDLPTTLAMIDTVDRFSHPIVNLRYQSLKKKYQARFVDQTEKKKTSSKNIVINDICSFYQNYWKTKLLDTLINSDSILYDNIAHYLVDNKLTSLSFDSLSQTIIDDTELSKVIAKEGFYSRFLILNGIQDALIWKKQKDTRYTVELPDEIIDVSVINIEDYSLRGATAYASFGTAQIGGWASNADSSLFCNKDTYRLGSEKFKVSYLKHESIHFTDHKNYRNLESADLEYRAKLVELIYCTKKTVYHRLNQFINGASSANRDHSHPFANYHLIHQLSEHFFSVEFERDFLKWKAIAPEVINKAALEIFNENTRILNEDPTINSLL